MRTQLATLLSLSVLASGCHRSPRPLRPLQLLPESEPDTAIDYSMKHPFIVYRIGDCDPDKYDLLYHAAIARCVADRTRYLKRKKLALERSRQYLDAFRAESDDYWRRHHPRAMAARLRRLLELYPEHPYSKALAAAIDELDRTSSLLKAINPCLRLPGKEKFKYLRQGDGNIECKAGTMFGLNVETLHCVKSVDVKLKTGALVPLMLASTGAHTSYGGSFLVTESTAYQIVCTDRKGAKETFGPYRVTLPKGNSPIAFAMGKPSEGLALGIAAQPNEPGRLLVRFKNTGKKSARIYLHPSYDCPLSIELVGGKQAKRFWHKSLGRTEDLVPHEIITIYPQGTYSLQISPGDFMEVIPKGRYRISYQLPDWLTSHRETLFKNIYRGRCSSGIIALPGTPEKK